MNRRHCLARIAALATACAFATAGAAEPGITDSTITLGMSAPFHGPNGAYGLEMKEAISAYIEAADTIARVEPQAVLMVTPYKPAGEFMKLMRQTGQRPRYLAVSTVGTDQLISLLGEGARGIGLSQVLPSPWNDTVPVVREYQRLIPQGDASAYSYSGLEGHLTIKLMVDALRKAGREPSREKLMQALEGMRNHDLGGFRVSYSAADHGGSKFVEPTVIGEGGRVRR